MYFLENLACRKRRAAFTSFVVATMLVANCVSIAAQRLGVTYDSQAQTAAALKRLSPASQQILDRIKQIGMWPLGDFRYATGITPNGESVSVDDSSWKTLQAINAAPADELWLRKWIEVPKTLDGYDPTGSAIWMPPAQQRRDDHLPERPARDGR